MRLPAAFVDGLPASLWRPGNRRLGARLHFCYGGAAVRTVRTVEWHGVTIGSGRRPRDSELAGH